jgi:hypothetical protein
MAINGQSGNTLLESGFFVPYRPPHTDRLERFFFGFKRGLIGTYQQNVRSTWCGM